MCKTTENEDNRSIKTEDSTQIESANSIVMQLIKQINCYTKLTSRIPARLVLYFLSWSGFLVSFMMRNDMNFAIVAMTTQNLNTDINNTEQLVKFSNTSNNQVVLADNTDNDLFDWSSTIQTIIVSSFYWCYVLSQVVGGIATQYFGTKFVFGYSQLLTALCSLCIPYGAKIHYIAVIILRSIQGFASGLTWPAMYAIVGFWIPLQERSRFMSSFQGFSIGIGLTYPLCGFLIKNFGWHYVFYTTGTLGIIWCLLWYLLAFNKPKEHPRISTEELQYIEMNINKQMRNTLSVKVPWKSIFKSIPAWSIGITTFGRIWIHYIFIVCGPNFMKNILQFDYQVNGFLSGMPFICSYISSVVFCYIADKLTVNNCLSLTNVRKLFTCLSQCVPGILIIWIAYLDANVILLLLIWFAAVTFITASYAGAMANIVDIAPNFAGPVLAFCQTIHMSASFLSPLVSGLLLTDNNMIDQWRVVFILSAIISILTYIVYHIFGTAKTEKWDYIERNEFSKINKEECEILNS